MYSTYRAEHNTVQYDATSHGTTACTVYFDTVTSSVHLHVSELHHDQDQVSLSHAHKKDIVVLTLCATTEPYDILFFEPGSRRWTHPGR